VAQGLRGTGKYEDESDYQSAGGTEMKGSPTFGVPKVSIIIPTLPERKEVRRMQLKLKVHEEAERDVETALIEAMFDREDLIESISEVEEFEPLSMACCIYSLFSASS
jgi:hypothetical protein